MSKVEMQRFHQEIMGDPALQKRLRQATNDSSLVSLALELGQERGYKFTKLEVEEYIKEVKGSSSEKKLSDEQLEAIVGGRAKSAAFYDNCSCGATSGNTEAQ